MVVLILFGLWVLTYALVLYFCWDVSIDVNHSSDSNGSSDEEREEQKDEGNEINLTHHCCVYSQKAHSPEINSQETSENKAKTIEKFHLDPVTKRKFSRKWINSQLPYTKGNHFWLVDREDLFIGKKTKNSIEIVRNVNTKTLTIRYWDNNRIDGVQLIFTASDKKILISEFTKGTECKMESFSKEEIDQLLVHAESLFQFYCQSSPYIKNLKLERYFNTQ